MFNNSTNIYNNVEHCFSKIVVIIIIDVFINQSELVLHKGIIHVLINQSKLALHKSIIIHVFINQSELVLHNTYSWSSNWWQRYQIIKL
jgi:hypothetical protein